MHNRKIEFNNVNTYDSATGLLVETGVVFQQNPGTLDLTFPSANDFNDAVRELDDEDFTYTTGRI